MAIVKRKRTVAKKVAAQMRGKWEVQVDVFRRGTEEAGFPMVFRGESQIEALQKSVEWIRRQARAIKAGEIKED